MRHSRGLRHTELLRINCSISEESVNARVERLIFSIRHDGSRHIVWRWQDRPLGLESSCSRCSANDSPEQQKPTRTSAPKYWCVRRLSRQEGRPSQPVEPIRRGALTNRQVRCLASDDNSSKCQRCARAGRECVYTVHSKTRRRKRTDTRVKELEEKVKNLSMLLEQGRLDGKNVPPLDILKEGDGMDDEADEEVSEDGEVDPPEEQLTSSGPKRSFSSYEALGPHSEGTDDQGLSKLASVATDPRSATENRGPNLAGCLSPDVVDRGVVDMGKAQELVDRYIDILSPEYPAVVFPTGTQASELRSNRPILWVWSFLDDEFVVGD